MNNDVAIAVNRLSHTFGKGELAHTVLHEVSTEVRSGEVVIVTGPSGSGKTTFLTLVAALRSIQSGSVTVLGRELRGAKKTDIYAVRRQIGFIFQMHNLLDSLTIEENVMMAMVQQDPADHPDPVQEARTLLEEVGLGDRCSAHPGELSGGMCQRVAIARALAGRPRIIMADEPTASLDGTSGREVVDKLHLLARKQGCAVLLVTHDNRILDIADRIVYLEDGNLTDRRPADMDMSV